MLGCRVQQYIKNYTKNHTLTNSRLHGSNDTNIIQLWSDEYYAYNLKINYQHQESKGKYISLSVHAACADEVDLFDQLVTQRFIRLHTVRQLICKHNSRYRGMIVENNQDSFHFHTYQP